MANIKSQIKRNRQNEKKRLRNRVYRGEARIAVKSARSSIDDGAPESKAALLQAISALDKAAEQGVIHKNNAARRKSRLLKAFAKMVPSGRVAEPTGGESVVPVESPKAPASKKKAVSRKVEESEVGSVEEPKAETKKTTTKSAPKPKKPAAKKTAASTTAKEKKTTTRTSSAKEKKPAAEE